MLKKGKMLSALIFGTLALVSLMAIPPLVRAPHSMACIEFSLNGVLIPGAVWCDAGQLGSVNDILIIFTTRARATMQFTVNGNPVGRRFRAPGRANDVHIQFDPNTGLITGAFWTRDDSRLPNPLMPPPGANDFILVVTVGVITNVWWTNNNNLVYQTGVPPGANDLRFQLVPAPH